MNPARAMATPGDVTMQKVLGDFGEPSKSSALQSKSVGLAVLELRLEEAEGRNSPL